MNNTTNSQYRYQFSNHQNENTFVNRNNDLSANSGYQQKYVNLSNIANTNTTNMNTANANGTLSNATSNNMSLVDPRTGKTNSRYPIELFAKKELSNQQTKLLNSYRIQSAQNLAKQRSTGK